MRRSVLPVLVLLCACTSTEPERPTRTPHEATRTTLASARGRQLGDLYVFTEAEARAELDHELWRPAQRAGVVAFGMAPNGDVWALDPARDDQVVLLSHDLIWDGSVPDVELAAVRFTLPLHELLAAAASGELPIDFYEARARLERGEDLVDRRSRDR